MLSVWLGLIGSGLADEPLGPALLIESSGIVEESVYPIVRYDYCKLAVLADDFRAVAFRVMENQGIDLEHGVLLGRSNDEIFGYQVQVSALPFANIFSHLVFTEYDVLGQLPTIDDPAIRLVGAVDQRFRERVSINGLTGYLYLLSAGPRCK